MGLPLPLPGRIPMPKGKVAKKMKKMGFVINGYEDDIDDDSVQQYVEYFMPLGWRLRDHSWRQDLPLFYFIDQNNMAHISISGQWNDKVNKLRIRLLKEPFLDLSARNKCDLILI